MHMGGMPATKDKLQMQFAVTGGIVTPAEGNVCVGGWVWDMCDNYGQ